MTVEITFHVERLNERWWCAHAMTPWHAQRMQGYGALQEDAIKRIKEIVQRAAPKGTTVTFVQAGSIPAKEG